jgi:hypothetical protein
MRGTAGAVGTVLAAVAIGAGAVPAAGAATARAASTPTAPPGYHRVISAPIPVPPGLGDAGAEVACPAGTVVWGGGTGFSGGTANPGESINTSDPTGNGWQGRYNNTNSALTDDHFVVEANCANRPAGYTVKFTTVDNPAGTQSAAVAVCPASTRLLSGGTQSTADTTDVQLLSAWPLDRHRFKSVMWNGSATDQRLTTFAICANKPPGYTITSGTGSDTGGPDVLIAGAQCPVGTKVVGGGLHITSPRPTITAGASFDDQATQWLTETVNLDPAPATETTYAICAA